MASDDDIEITESCLIRPNPHPDGRREQPCELRVGPYPTMIDGSYSATLFMDDVRMLRDCLTAILPPSEQSAGWWGVYNQLDGDGDPYLVESVEGRLAVFVNEAAAERAISALFGNDRRRYIAAPIGMR